MIIENDEIKSRYWIDNNKKYINSDRYQENNKNKNEYKKNQENKKNKLNNDDNNDENVIIIKIIKLSDWYNLINNLKINKCI